MSSALGVSTRRMGIAAMGLLMVLVAFASFVSNDASAKGKKAKVTISVTTKNQAALTKAGKVTVKVKSTAKAKVSLSATLSGKSKHFKKKTVKFSKNKKQTKTISLVLTSSGKTEAKKCGAKTVLVKGTYKKGKKKATAKKKKSLAKDSTRCTPPIEYTEVPLGDNPASCDFLDTTVCLQPFPNDYYTKADASTPTGKRLNLAADSTPVNTGNANPANLSVTDINRADGFSPGSAIILKVPGLDTPAAFQNSNLVPLEDISAYDDPDQAVILIDAATGDRVPIWAELDSNPTTVDPTFTADGPDPDDDPDVLNPGGINTNPGNTGPVNLMIREAKNLTPGHRYIVAFRNLKNAENATIEAPVGFKVYRDNLPTQQEIVENRRPHMESVISDLTTKAGVDRSSLYMAWDFTVASEKSTTGRMTTIRDDAFSRLGDTDLDDRKIQGASPDIDVLAYCDFGNTSANDPMPGINRCGSNYPGVTSYNPANPPASPVPNGTTTQRTVVGYIRDVPCYLDEDGCPSGSEFAFDSNDELTWNPAYTMDVPFRCIIPKSIVSGGVVDPGGTGTYGHGLLGSLNQVNSSEQLASQSESTYCAMNFDGFSDSDIGLIIQSLGNMSNFNKAVDRMQQGFVNFLMVQRALVHPDGFADEPAFEMTFDGTTPLASPGSAIDVTAGADTRGTYYGISQGGIMGGAVTAISPDADRGILGVPGINYSTLLRRSVDSDEYFKLPGLGLYANYPDLASRPVLLGLMQQLWDRGEGNGYANNMTTDPLENTPPHQVLLQLALGDHQVTNYAAEVEARTIGAKRYSPTLLPQRTWDMDYEGLPPVSTFPTAPGQSYMVYYDGGPPAYNGTQDPGAALPPLENVPPRPEWGYGSDPHGMPRRAADAIEHERTFVQDGTIGACAAVSQYCFSNGWDGVTGLP